MKKSIKLLIIIGSILVLLLIIFLFLNYKKNNNTDNINNNLNNNLNNNFKIEPVKNTIRFYDYTIVISEQYTYEYDLNNNKSILLVNNSSKPWSAYMELYDEKDTNSYDNPKEYVKRLKSFDFDVSNGRVLEYNKKNIVLMDYNDKETDTDAIIAYYKMDSEHGVEITIYCAKGEKPTDKLTDVLKIISTAKKIK